MQKEDILKYSQQFIAYFKHNEPRLFNGFLMRNKWYIYLITVNHGLAIDFDQAEKIYLILHANSEGLSTRAFEIETWHFVNLLKFPDESGLAFPYVDERVDFAYCIVDNKVFEASIEILPFILQDAESSFCHQRTIYPIAFPPEAIVPSKCKKYYLAGKIMNFVNDAYVECKTYFYEDMTFIGDWEGLWEFHINQQSTIDDWAGQVVRQYLMKMKIS